jgi:hypothetical protein
MRISGLVLLALVFAPAGCSTSTTETGYEPRHLGMSDAQRKALYAPKYTIEQAQAQSERDAEIRRKPGASFGTPY